MSEKGPTLLLDRPPGAQVVLAIAGPVLAGAIAGALLVISEGAYLVVSIVAILGGIGAGFEHRDAGEGARRGFCGGLLFGTSILLVGALSGKHAKADLPDPQWVLVIITTVLGMLFGAIGGAGRASRDRGGAAS